MAPPPPPARKAPGPPPPKAGGRGPAPPPPRGAPGRRQSLFEKPSGPKLRPLFWTAISQAPPGANVWDEPPSPFDVVELERQFAINQQKPIKTTRRNSPVETSRKRLQMLDRKSGELLSIAFSRFPAPEKLANIMASLEQFPECLLPENIFALHTAAMEHQSIIDQLRDMDVKVSELGQLDLPERYLWVIASVPDCKVKIACGALVVGPGRELSDIGKAANRIAESCAELRGSLLVRRCITTALAIGNVLNRGTSRSAARAVVVPDSMLKLSELRASADTTAPTGDNGEENANKGPTLLDFVAQTLVSDVNLGASAEDLRIESDRLKDLALASKTVCLDDSDLQCQNIFNDSVKAHAGISSIAGAERLTELVGCIRNNAREIQQMVNIAKEEFVRTQEWSSARPKVTSEEWFSGWAAFFEQLSSAFRRTRPTLISVTGISQQSTLSSVAEHHALDDELQKVNSSPSLSAVLDSRQSSDQFPRQNQPRDLLTGSPVPVSTGSSDFTLTDQDKGVDRDQDKKFIRDPDSPVAKVASPCRSRNVRAAAMTPPVARGSPDMLANRMTPTAAVPRGTPERPTNRMTPNRMTPNRGTPSRGTPVGSDGEVGVVAMRLREVTHNCGQQKEDGQSDVSDWSQSPRKTQRGQMISGQFCNEAMEVRRSTITRRRRSAEIVPDPVRSPTPLSTPSTGSRCAPVVAAVPSPQIMSSSPNRVVHMLSPSPRCGETDSSGLPPRASHPRRVPVGTNQPSSGRLLESFSPRPVSTAPLLGAGSQQTQADVPTKRAVTLEVPDAEHHDISTPKHRAVPKAGLTPPSRQRSARTPPITTADWDAIFVSANTPSALATAPVLGDAAKAQVDLPTPPRRTPGKVAAGRPEFKMVRSATEGSFCSDVGSPHSSVDPEGRGFYSCSDETCESLAPSCTTSPVRRRRSSQSGAFSVELEAEIKRRSFSRKSRGEARFDDSSEEETMLPEQTNSLHRAMQLTPVAEPGETPYRDGRPTNNAAVRMNPSAAGCGPKQLKF